MAKMKLDKDRVVGFFTHHVEKIVLAIVILLLGVFVYTGYSLEGLRERPSDLDSLASSATSKMNEDTWPAVKAEFLPPTGHTGRVQESRVATVDTYYMADKPLMPARVQPTEKRKDPTLFAPVKLEVYSVTGPVAYRMKPGDTDPLADSKDPKFKEKEVKRAPEKKKKKGFSYGPGMEGGEGMSSSAMSAMGSMPMSAMPGAGGMGMGSMEGGEMMGESGFSPGGMAGAGTTAKMGDFPGFRAGPGAIPRPTSIIAVKALFEWKKQWDEFDRAFSNSAGYNPGRDVPRFLLFSAQRADVTDDPNKTLEESDWKPIANTNSIVQQLREKPFYNFAPEIVDSRYLSPFVLTMPIPPLMMRDLDPLALHSETPRQQVSAMTTMAGRMGEGAKKEGEKKEGEEAKEGAEEEAIAGDVPGDVPGAGPGGAMYGPMGGVSGGLAGKFGAGGMAGGLEGAGTGYPGMPSGMPMSGMPSGMPMSGMPSGMPSGMSMSGMSGMGYPGMSGAGSDYGASEGESGMMGESSGYGPYGGMPGMSMVRGPQVDYVLVRFYDLTAEPGHLYRYRVQVLLEDPNHPENPLISPNERTLDDSVKTRLAQVAEEEKTKNRRVYYLRTEWSAPSDPIAPEDPVNSLAGTVQPLKLNTIANSQQKIPADEPKGSVMSIVWDPVRAVDVPGLQEVYRGAVLNFTETVNVIHPITFRYRGLENFNFDTGRCVLDIRGGEPLPGSTDTDPLTAPGEFLFFDDQGRFFVRNEFDDMDTVARYTPPEIAPPPTVAPGYGGEEGGEMGGPGYGSRMSGMSGPGGGSRPGKGKRSGGSRPPGGER